MNIERIKKNSFVVIGKEGSTNDGDGFIQKLWKEANSNFNEVANLAKKNETGDLCGVWGVMSDFSHSFNTWENNFSQGLYLAGVECLDNAVAPKGWVKWVIPGYEYLRIEVNSQDSFVMMIDYLNKNNISLVGAVHDFSDPITGKNYMYFPIKKI